MIFGVIAHMAILILRPVTRVGLKTGDIAGMKVQGMDEKKLDTINDLLLDPVEEDIQYYALDFGGLLESKDTYFAVLMGRDSL